MFFVNNIDGSKKVVLSLFAIFAIFLTFKFLVSINLGFEIRIPHFLFGGIFVLIAMFITFQYKKMYFKNIWILIMSILLFSILNRSFLSAYFYYLFIIIFINYSIFLVLLSFNISLKKIINVIVYATVIPILLSYSTIGHTWYGGFQIDSYSDFPTFFSMQISTIFPFIFLIQNKMRRNIILLIFSVTILLLAARGPILALFIAYLFIFRSKINIKHIIYVFIMGIVFICILSIVNTGLLNYFYMKINPFAENYNMISDMNRWLYIVATIEHSLDGMNWLFGSGIKTNFDVIHNFFENEFVNTFDNFMILDGASVHNVFLELLSDLGIIPVVLLIYLLFHTYNRLDHADNTLNISLKASIICFFVNYNTEPNYVHFFFWFFLFFYQFASLNQRLLFKKEL